MSFEEFVEQSHGRPIVIKGFAGTVLEEGEVGPTFALNLKALNKVITEAFEKAYKKQGWDISYKNGEIVLTPPNTRKSFS
jgi:hypothetical protein